MEYCDVAPPANRDPLDAIIIGGGPAGLSAALVLGRCLRHVLVCDVGHPRNEAAKVFNGYLSRDGSTPGEFLQICRAQLRRYETVEFRKVKVVDVERGDRRFTAVLETGERVASRMLLLATGLVDELPEIENFREFYGRSAHSCAYCDGWEHRGQPIAVTGCTQDAAICPQTTHSDHIPADRKVCVLSTADCRGATAPPVRKICILR